MPKRVKILAAAGAAVILGAAVAWTTFINYSPHFFSANECFECHFTTPGPEDPRPFRFTKPITELCGRCHKMDALSHIVDVAPSMRMPGGMPLDEQGRMTCATCHDPHRNRLDKAGRKTYYLRTERQGKDFCLLCHEDPKNPGKLSIFSVRGQVTHRRSMTRSHGFANMSVPDRPALDPVSLMCMKCHKEDEELADPEKLAKGVWTHGGGIGLSHPIGVDYDDASWRNRELAPIEKLDGRVKLFDRKIGCCTCHDPYNEGQGLAIGVPGGYQELCLACHKV